MGKNASGNTGRVEGFRRKGDFYETHYSMTGQLLEVEDFPGTILEASCGGGAIVKVLKENNLDVVAYDLQTPSRLYGIQSGKSFFDEKNTYPYSIQNPPFSQAKQFILQAKKVVEKKFAFLLPLSYLHGIDRLSSIWLDREFPLARVHIFARYPMLGDPLRDDGKYDTGYIVYAWYVWEREYEGEPVIRWVNNQRYILSKKDR